MKGFTYRQVVQNYCTACTFQETFILVTASHGLEQAHIHRPSLVASAQEVTRIVITAHEAPYNTIVPAGHALRPLTDADLASVHIARKNARAEGAYVGQIVDELKGEWRTSK